MVEIDLKAGFLASPLFRDLEKQAKAAEAGEPYPESDAKRHHFVPEFVLRRFARERDGRLMQFESSTGRPRWADPSTAASRTRFYRFTDDDGTVHQRVEFFLSKVESYAAPALRQLVQAPQRLTLADRATLSMFFALLPDFRSSWAHLGVLDTVFPA